MCLFPVCLADDTQTGQSHSRASHTDRSVCVGASLGWFPVWAVLFFFFWTYACILVWMYPRCGCRVFESACVSVHRLQDLCVRHIVCLFRGTIPSAGVALRPKHSLPSSSCIRSSFWRQLLAQHWPSPLTSRLSSMPLRVTYMMGTKPCVAPSEHSSQSESALLRTCMTSPLLKLSWPGSVAMWWHSARTSLRNNTGYWGGGKKGCYMGPFFICIVYLMAIGCLQLRESDDVKNPDGGQEVKSEEEVIH